MLDRLADLNAACRAIAGADGLEELLRVVTESAQQLIGTHQAVTSRLVHGWTEATTHVSLSDKYAEYRDYDEPPQGLGVLNAVTRENRSLRLSSEELVDHPDWRGLRDAPGHPPLPDYLAAPLISRDGRNIGLIQLSDKVDGGKFTEDDEVLLVQVAQMASATLEHVELLERERAARAALERRAHEADLVAAVGVALTGGSGLDGKLRSCVQALVEHLDLHSARIWTLDESGEQLTLQAAAGASAAAADARVRLGRRPIGRIAAEGRPYYSNDPARDPELWSGDDVTAPGSATFAGHPLVVMGHAVGVLAILARGEVPAQTRRVLEAVADALAVAIEQSRDAEQLALRARQMHGLAQVASEVNLMYSLNEVLDRVTCAAREIVGAHQAMTRFTRDRAWERAITSVSMSERYAQWRDAIEPPDGAGLSAWVCERQRPCRMTQAELEAHPRWQALAGAGDRRPPMRGWLAAPLTAPDGANLGLIELSDKTSGDFTAEDEAALVQLAEIASSAIHKTHLLEDRVRVAMELQRSLLPPSLPQIPRMDLAARYTPGAEEVGGDFYDVFPVRGRAWGMVIGDVRGKGPDAAALTALARHSSRTAAMLQRRPRGVLSVVNEALCDTDDPERFCSMAFARLTAGKDDVRVEVASAGHPPLLILRAGGDVEAVEPTGPLVGLFRDVAHADQTLRLGDGDALVAYTDGITEARRGDEWFGEDRLASLLAGQRGASADDLAEIVVHAAGEFADASDTDDAAVLVLRVRPRH